ncbi:ATP-binding protein [Streptomyces sp. NBC_01231]|nr:ATP-binding protein [Streptomyces sp. NBC_01231]
MTGFELKAGAETVTVAVHDASPRPPRLLQMDATRPGGFGWHLVQDLSADVRVQIHPAGKTVTAIVPCPTGIKPRG